MEIATSLTATNFQTAYGDRTFPFMEDGDGSRYYGYGHQDRATFAAALDEYFRLVDPPEVHDPVGPGGARHVYAVVTDAEGRGFEWRNEDVGYVSAQTPGSFPLTLVSL